MTDSEKILRLVRILATYPVLPPAELLPPNDDAFRSLLAELARAGGSPHAATLQAVSAALRVPVDELARRAQFLLTCLLMPASGTHYEVLGVAPDATKQQIRKRWATLMQRYHPDRLSGAAPGSNWLDGQARRLIEAYNTLKDPARRRAYDAQLARDIGAPPPLMAERWRDRTIHFGRPNRWKWAPAGIAAIGIVAVLWVASRPAREPLPRVPLPAAPNLLDRSGTTSAETATMAASLLQPGRSSGAEARRDEARPTEPGRVEELPPLKPHLATVPPEGTAPRAATGSSAPPPVILEPVAVAPAASPAPPPQAAAPTVLARPLEPEPSAVAVVALPAPPSTGAPARAEILALIERFRAAYERKDLTAVMALLGTEARDRDVAGRPAVEHLYVKNFATLEDIRYELAQLDVKLPAGNGELVVEGWFRIRATQVTDKSQPLDLAGPIRWLLRREDGMLRIVGIEYEATAR